MDWFVKAFVKASLAWLALGVTLGVAMAARPGWAVYRPAHLHMTLLGFVAMMISGVGYHVLPRFAGHPLRVPWLAALHWWMASAGLALFAAGFMLRPHGISGASTVLGSGAALSVAGAYAFAWNIWRTLRSAERRQAVDQELELSGRRRPLPMAAH